MRISGVVVVGAALAGAVASMPTVARADNVTIAAGAAYTLTGDIVLSGSDSFTAGDPAGARCQIHGGGFSIHSADDTWSGNFSLQNCDVDGLGVEGGMAIQLSLAGALTISKTVFSNSSEVDLTLRDAASVAFTDNVIAVDSVTKVVTTSLDQSQDAFHVKGGSTGSKVFQRNLVRRERLHFELTGDWLVEGNTLVGDRTGIFVDRCGPITIRGNYSHSNGLGWNQVKNISAFSTEGNTIVEHNVLVGLAWNTEVHGPGEIRYNLIVNPVERAWVQLWATSNTKVHHNLMIQSSDNQFKEINGGFVVFGDDPPITPTPPPSSEIYNNTFDAGGTCNPGLAGAVTVGDHLLSLRSNAFVNIRLPGWTGITLVGQQDKMVPDPLPSLLGYADYNLFHNPDGSVKANYGVGVAGKTLRADAGFGYNDVPVGGAANAQVDPAFAGPIPHKLAFDEQSVLDGTTSVCHILAYYRRAYAPDPSKSSPLIDAGDPAEGAGNDIGAIGAGADNALDQFGKLCDPNDVGPIAPSQDVFTCATVGLEGGGGGGNPPVPPGGHGFICVCQAGAGAPATAPFVAVLAVAALALARRRRR